MTYRVEGLVRTDVSYPVIIVAEGRVARRGSGIQGLEVLFNAMGSRLFCLGMDVPDVRYHPPYMLAQDCSSLFTALFLPLVEG